MEGDLGGLRDLIRAALTGDRRALARLITLVENSPEAALETMRAIYPRTGNARVVGVTGPPGCGKSTLIAALAKEMRKEGKTVGIVAIDPSSAFTGGAMLGDRVRMLELSQDHGVFIRSMATRGALGGLARSTADTVRILDAASMDYILVETAGAGQGDVDIAKLVSTTIVVMAPGLGDEIQALKAGLMEIGDIFVVNKGDREDADSALRQIRGMLRAGADRAGWVPPVIKTVATQERGIGELLRWINEHAEYRAKAIEEEKSLEKAGSELVEALMREIEYGIVSKLARSNEFAELARKIASREIDPYSAADRLIRAYLHSSLE